MCHGHSGAVPQLPEQPTAKEQQLGSTCLSVHEAPQKS